MQNNGDNGLTHATGLPVTHEGFIKKYLETRVAAGWTPMDATGCTDVPPCEFCRIKTNLENQVKGGRAVCKDLYLSTCNCEFCRTLRK